jgi:AcrR family transcriptional regulator
MSHSDTKTRILDGAEQLFAREGFHNTSLRALTSLAEVNLASVNYHFGSKEALLQAVIERRLLPLNAIREEKIEAVLTLARQNSKPPAAENLLRAFIEPTLEFRNSSPGARDFIYLIGRALSEPDETIRNCFVGLVLPLFQLLFKGLSEALPQLAPEILLARLQFIMGSMSHVMCMGSHSSPPPGLPPSLESKALTDQLLKFVLAGLEAPA